MGKVHTKEKRRLGIRSTTRKHRYWFTKAETSNGPRSFRSTDAAEQWAKEQGLDTKELELHELQQGKKYQWRKKPKE